MATAQAHARPIPGAVATLGVSDRVTFLRKTYAHLGGALIVFAVLTWAMMNFATEFSLRFTAWSWSGWNFLIVFLLFIGAGVLAQRLAMHETSKGLQYLGLGIEIVAFSFMLQPLLWIVMQKFGGAIVIGKNGVVYPHLSATAASVIGQSAVITLAIFAGLTATVFLTRKDFSFLRGILSISMFAVIGFIIASLIFGFSIGILFSAFIILLMAGYILYETSLVMNYFPPTAHVAAALMLFATVAVLFTHVLRLMSFLRGND
jgi:FtsH-binding integral membrane protein